MTPVSSSHTFAGKTGLLLLMITIIVLFGTLTLAFLLTARPQVELAIPTLFYVNLLFLLLSSGVFHVASEWEPSPKKRQYQQAGIWLGILFLATQTYAWIDMLSSGLSLNGSGPELGFLYLLSGLHALHLLGGLVFMGVIYQKGQEQSLSYEELGVYFWHFLGVLWLFLLAVLSLHA